MRQQLEPGPDHPITIERKDQPVRVSVAGEPVLTTRTYLEVREANYPAVAYLPRHQIDMRALERSGLTTWCPYKSEAAYYHLHTTDGTCIENAVWTYETPFPAVSDIKDALAVYTSKVDAIEIG
ncbi:MAG: DUF427 domain-containing protein [Pseudomonadota bacterium]